VDLTLEDRLFDAWDRVRPRLLADADELRARLARGRARYADRPLRAWCLCVRANDTRINAATAICVPDDCDEPDPATGQYRPHRVTLDARLLGRICPPVRLTPPGQRVREVCDLLGVRQASQLQAARLKGRFQVHYVHHLGGTKGAAPLLYAPGPLDPAAHLFDEPDPVWTWTAHYISSRIPDDVCQTVERVPLHLKIHPPERPRSYTRRLPPVPLDYVEYARRGKALEMAILIERRRAHNRVLRQRRKLAQPKPRKPSPIDPLPRFAGWRWLCPGCGGPVKKLYYPLGPTNVLRHTAADVLRLDAPATDPAPAPPPCFACQACHKVEYLARPCVREAWNIAVTYLTGGLLYGHEVPMPETFTPNRRRMRPTERTQT